MNQCVEIRWNRTVILSRPICQFNNCAYLNRPKNKYIQQYQVLVGQECGKEKRAGAPAMHGRCATFF